jgi:hypothetical protein
MNILLLLLILIIINIYIENVLKEKNEKDEDKL